MPPPRQQHPRCFHYTSNSVCTNTVLISFCPTPQLSNTCLNCTSYFRDQSSTNASPQDEGRFLSETCEVYAFGSNSSSQLAMGSAEKFLKATSMQHMSNVQVVGIHIVIHSDMYVCRYPGFAILLLYVSSLHVLPASKLQCNVR